MGNQVVHVKNKGRHLMEKLTNGHMDGPLPNLYYNKYENETKVSEIGLSSFQQV
jgi:hypothetical protein